MIGDFQASAKIVLKLARVSLALGREDEAIEAIRRALCAAAQVERYYTFQPVFTCVEPSPDRHR
jgi:hypothetical protein